MSTNITVTVTATEWHITNGTVAFCGLTPEPLTSVKARLAYAETRSERQVSTTQILTVRPVDAMAVVPGTVYHPDMACAMLARQATVARATIAEHATCETVRALNAAAGIRRATGPLALVTCDEDVEAGLAFLAGVE